MSAPLNLTAEQLRSISYALDGLARITKENGVSLTPYQRLEVGIGDNVLRVAWDEQTEAYVIDDRNGE